MDGPVQKRHRNGQKHHAHQHFPPSEGGAGGPGGLAPAPEQKAVEGAGKGEGQRAGGQSAQKARAQPALGDEGGAKAHQGKHQRVKAGDDLRQHQIADHTHCQGEDGGADRRLCRGGRGHRFDQGEERCRGQRHVGRRPGGEGGDRGLSGTRVRVLVRSPEGVVRECPGPGDRAGRRGDRPGVELTALDLGGSRRSECR